MGFDFSSGGSVGGEENKNKWVNEFVEDSEDYIYGAGNDGLYIYHPLKDTLANLDSMGIDEQLWLCLDSNENVHMVSRNGAIASYGDDMRIEQTGNISSDITDLRRAYNIESTPSDNLYVVGQDSNYNQINALVDSSDFSIIWEVSGSNTLGAGDTGLFMSVHNDGNVYQSSQNDNIITIDLETGDVINTVGEGARYPRLRAGPDGFVYAGNWDDYTLDKVNPSDGSIDWKVSLTERLIQCVYTPFDQIWAVDNNSRIYAIKSDGSVIDTFRLSDQLLTLSYPFDEDIICGIYGSASAAIFIATTDNGRIKSDISVPMEENTPPFSDDMTAAPVYETHPELY